MTRTENVASRGAREITSCQRSFLNEQIGDDEPIDTPIAWIDSCGGQNRNFIMTCFWLCILSLFEIDNIIHRFPISGHSYLPNDQDFGDVEKAQKRKTQFTMSRNIKK